MEMCDFPMVLTLNFEGVSQKYVTDRLVEKIVQGKLHQYGF